MITLLISSLLLIFISAWFLSRPFRVKRSEHEASAQQGQYVLARDRLLQQLEQIDVQAADGLLEKETASSETARLEYELAGILKQLEAGSETAGQEAGVDAERALHSGLVWAGFSLLLLTGTFILYGVWQADTLLSLANQTPSSSRLLQTTSMPEPVRSPVTVPPEALAMVTRLEGKLEKTPGDGEGWKRLGRSYMVMGRNRDAVSAYSRASELLPNDPQVKAALQQLSELAALGGRHPQETGKQKMLVAQPELQESVLERINQLEAKVATSPDDAMSWARLGRSYLNIKRQADAERAYARAYTLEPENTVILATYAGIIFARNPRDPGGKALDLFKQLHALAPEHPDGLWFIGLAAYNERNFARSIELWTKLLGILPPETEGYASVRNALAKAEALSNMQK